MRIGDRRFGRIVAALAIASGLTALSLLKTSPCRATDAPIIVELPSSAYADAVDVSLGSVSFRFPKIIQSFGPPPRSTGAIRYAVELSLEHLAELPPQSPRFLHVEITYDPAAHPRDSHEALLNISDLSTKQVDANGFTTYKNKGGEMLEKQDAQGRWFSFECTSAAPSPSGWPPLCSRTSPYSDSISVAYSFPRAYAPRAMDIDAELLRFIDKHKVN
jgi:hypothetical protein